jgi:cyclic dehypoxanthinyl futalosine synthase
MTMRISQQEALDLFDSDDLIGIGMAANEVRRQKTDPRVATYQIDRNINYTNFCTEYCSFCAFYRPIGAKDGYILPLESIYEKIEEMLEIGGTGVLMQGGLHPDLRIEFYENMLSSIKRKFPQVHLHCFSAPEITCIAEVSGLSLHDTIARLRDAGLDSIPGGGAEILDDEIRARISRLKCTSAEWEQVHRTAHALGMRTTATMMFGCGEEHRHRANHLELLRRIQDDTGGFTAFIPWIFAPENTPLGKKIPEATAFDYLKTLAISRIYLDNIDHIQSSWLTPGIKICQVGLQFGADDVGSILIEENVVYAAGVRNRTNEAELRRIISDAGYIPAQRDTLYRSYIVPKEQSHAAAV